jgi:O-antigen/teichoic acid export membrane protein
MVTLIQIFASFNLFFRGSLAAFEFFKLDGLFMVLDRTLMIILCGLMIWMPGFLELNIQHFVLIQLLVLMVVSITLIITLYQKMETFKLALDFSGLRRILSKSWPFGVLFALMSLYHYLDSVMLEKLSSNGVTDVSIYAQGYRIFYALLLFSHVFSNIMLPIFSKQKRNPSQLISFVDYNTRLLLWIAISVAFIGWSYKLEIMQILFPNKNPELAAMPFGLIILGYIGTVLMVLFGTFLTALRQLKILNWLVFFTVIINVVLNAIFIPLYGVTGAAFATLISQFLLGLSSFISTKSILTNWMVTRTIFQILTFASLFGLLAIILKTTFTNPIIHLGLCATAIISGGLILRLRKG